MFLSRVIIQEILFTTGVLFSDGWHFWTSVGVGPLLEVGSIFSYLPISCVFHSYLWDRLEIWLPRWIKSSLFVVIYWESVLCRPWSWVLEGTTEDSDLRGLEHRVFWDAELGEAGPARESRQGSGRTWAGGNVLVVVLAMVRLLPKCVRQMQVPTWKRYTVVRLLGGRRAWSRMGVSIANMGAWFI